MLPVLKIMKIMCLKTIRWLCHWPPLGAWGESGGKPGGSLRWGLAGKRSEAEPGGANDVAGIDVEGRMTCTKQTITPERSNFPVVEKPTETKRWAKSINGGKFKCGEQTTGTWWSERKRALVTAASRPVTTESLLSAASIPTRTSGRRHQADPGGLCRPLPHHQPDTYGGWVPLYVSSHHSTF